MNTAQQLVSQGLLAERDDWQELAAQFSRNGRVQLADVLRPSVADLLHRCLVEQVPWSLAFRDRQGAQKLSAEQLQQVGPQQHGQINQRIAATAATGFGFRYSSYMMIPAYLNGQDPKLPLHQVVEQLNAPQWLREIAKVAGCHQASKTDAQATRYQAGDFLSEHNDYQRDDNRLVAYVINLTKDWRPDWGGLLQFIGPDHTVAETYTPTFNSLSLFAVPTLHCVSPVAAHATGSRYAITGWLRGN